MINSLLMYDHSMKILKYCIVISSILANAENANTVESTLISVQPLPKKPRKTYLCNAGGLVSSKFGKFNVENNSEFEFKYRLSIGLIAECLVNSEKLINLGILTIAEIPKDFGIFSTANYTKDKHAFSLGFGFQKANFELNQSNKGTSGWAILGKYQYQLREKIQLFAIYRLAKLQNFGYSQISIGASYKII